MKTACHGSGKITYANGRATRVNGKRERNGRGTFFTNGARYVAISRQQAQRRGSSLDERQSLRRRLPRQTSAPGTARSSTPTAIRLRKGDFVDGKAQARTRTYAAGGRYDGEWRNDLPNDMARASQRRQSYAGHWQNGCFREGSRWATVGVTPTVRLPMMRSPISWRISDDGLLAVISALRWSPIRPGANSKILAFDVRHRRCRHRGGARLLMQIDSAASFLAGRAVPWCSSRSRSDGGRSARPSFAAA